MLHVLLNVAALFKRLRSRGDRYLTFFRIHLQLTFQFHYRAANSLVQRFLVRNWLWMTQWIIVWRHFRFKLRHYQGKLWSFWSLLVPATLHYFEHMIRAVISFSKVDTLWNIPAILVTSLHTLLVNPQGILALWYTHNNLGAIWLVKNISSLVPISA